MLTHLEHGLSWQFATAEGITQQLSGPRVKLPPPVLQENGHIDKEYFSVLAAKEGACVTNSPASFPEDHAGKCIVMCVLLSPSCTELLSLSIAPPPRCVTPLTCATVPAFPFVVRPSVYLLFCLKAGAVTPHSNTVHHVHWAADRMERCCKTQEIAQAVHGASTLDVKALQAYVGTTVKIALRLSLSLAPSSLTFTNLRLNF